MKITLTYKLPGNKLLFNNQYVEIICYTSGQEAFGSVILFTHSLWYLSTNMWNDDKNDPDTRNYMFKALEIWGYC
jgi:hypothetical protein